jgi:hypothetical protein
MNSFGLIYIAGIDKRSGTNFLAKLLQMHPLIKYCDHPGEDFLLFSSQHLVQYIEGATKMWSDEWKGMTVPLFSKKLNDVLLRSLSDYLGVTGDHYTLTKTPSTVGMENFFRFFPEGRLIILVRDGRNLVESGVQSFGWKYQSGFKRWAESAWRIIQFTGTYRKWERQFLVIKYEDLNEHPEKVLTEILNHFEIDQSVYPYDEIQNVPVIGSSTSSEVAGKIDWSKQLKKTEDFKPNERYLHWSYGLRQSYNRICGEYARHFDYEVFDEPKNFFQRLLVGRN